jgi:hypothetical protein
MTNESRPQQRYGEAFWRAHHEAWKRSDLNQREYCESQNIPLKAFGNWRAGFKAEPQPRVPRLLYRRRGLSHILSHILSHSLSHPLSHVMVWTAPAPASGSNESRAKMVVVEQRIEGAPSMGKSNIDLSSVTTVGLDLAKYVFQVHCLDASGRVVVAKAIRRGKLLEFFASLPPCLVGLEACGSAHHWGRELIKLGHDARMMPPAYVKPYVRRQKNDAADAAAVCEAVTRPSMRFVGVRSLENQAALMRHKTREMLVCQRTQLLNGLRGHLVEVGVIAPQGPRYARELADRIEAGDETIALEVCEALAPLVVQLRNSTKRSPGFSARSQSLRSRMKRRAG